MKKKDFCDIISKKAVEKRKKRITLSSEYFEPSFFNRGNCS